MSTGLQIVAAFLVMLVALVILCIVTERQIAKIPTENFPQRGGENKT